GVDCEKREKIESLGLEALEFDFSGTDRVITKDRLRSTLLTGNRQPGQGWGEWLYHPALQQAQREVDREFLATKDAIRNRLQDEGKKRQKEAKRKEEDALNERL